MRAAGFAIVVATLAACDQKVLPPTTPTPTVPITSLQFTGPEVIAPGASGQVTVIANYADGTSQDVTSQSTFRSSGGSARVGLAFPGNGEVRSNPGTDPGFVRYFAMFNGTNSSPWTFFVLAPGTFALHGAITEEGSPDQLGAVVEIIGGTGVGVGLRAQRVELGRYGFYGVAGDLEIRASVAGYEAQVHRVNLTSTTTLDIDLRPLVPAAGVSGAWTMTVTPASMCAANLPAVAIGRVLGVQFVQQGGNLQALFSGPTIHNVNNAPEHRGSVLGETLSFYINSREFDSFNEALLFDRLGPTQWIGISGLVRGTVAEPEFKAVLSGNVDLYTGPAGANFPPSPPIAGCPGDHALTFRRK